MFLHGALCRNLYKSFSAQLTPTKHRLTTQHLKSYFTPKRRISGDGPAGQKKGLVPTPFDGVRVETGPVQPSNLGKCTIFALAFSTGSFLGAAVWEYESIRSRIKDKKIFSHFTWYRAKLNHKRTEWRREVDSYWSNLSPGEKVFVPICALNVLVFALWRIPRLQPAMVKYFCSNPSARAVCWPMVFSTFSHYSMFHLFANMYVLHSFSNAAVAVMGKEQFLGLYLSAGVISTLASYFYKAATGNIGLSLGASGAIMAILAFVCFEYPDTQLSILFLPMYTFPAGAAIKVIMGLDLAGCMLGWKFFDHAAHLGGAFLGMFWSFFGSDLIWPQRERFLKVWHNFRTVK